ncbi:MAG: hypothetical protein CMG74_07675 [Candidatus Marinimicrobia bacterium]|nr:hypothetical protein [Candidatus Neomarinimicrobiota bacterium]|tara:strand:+ start:1570 stop:1992 length:423 start_codon:yes stop_codon:yes gene_type:complete
MQNFSKECKSKIIFFKKILNSSGNLTFIESNNQIDFNINRVYWIYDVPGAETRGGHAYNKLQEVIIALSGSFDLIVDDGLSKKKKFRLNRSYEGVYIPGKTWRELKNFSTNAVALVLASNEYNENDYIREYSKFTKLVSI